MLAHRIVLDAQARFAGATGAALVADILREVPVPAQRAPLEGLSIRRELPRHATAGEPFVDRVVLANRGTRAATARPRTALPI